MDCTDKVLYIRDIMMIHFQKQIEDIDKYQNGKLPQGAQKLRMPPPEQMMKKAFPIAACLCAVMFVSMFLKTFISHSSVIHPIGILIGAVLGFALMLVHELLHAAVYPKNADVTIGKLKGKLVFVALASYPMKRNRFILMCLLPFVLGIIPLVLFVISPPENKMFNGIMFGMACMGMVSPFPDVYNVIQVLKQAKKKDSIMFHRDDTYRVP